jgi:uncharacterized membrane protein
MSSQANPPGRAIAVRLNRWTLSLSRHWLRTLLIVIGVYVTLPFVAPTLMHLGLTGPANFLYTIYSPMCHQLAFRSWFLYGEQPAYPRAAANFPGLQPYEAYAADVNKLSNPPIDLRQWTWELEILSRQFVGDERMGYKVAICERDIAIYGALFLGGLIYAIPTVRRHLRPVPIWLYLLLGVVPIGVDGFSQLLGYPPFSLWPIRETTPLFRTLTGGLFGIMNAWLAFPHLEASAREVVIELENKFARARRRQAEAH